MIRLAVIFILLAGYAFGSYAPVGASSLMQPSIYGDSRYGALRNLETSFVRFQVALPVGQHQAFTVVGWFRLKPKVAGTHYLTTSAFWCPEPQQRRNPDLLSGAGAHGIAGGTNLTTLGGSITVASFPFTAYTNAIQAPVSNKWARGVYTLDGWSSNAVTVSLGGTDYILGPGLFHRNAEPGPAASVVVSGSDLVSIGISKTPCHRYFDELDGVVTSNNLLSASSIVTNEIAMCVWRFKIEGSNQIYRSDLGRIAAFNELSQIKTNDYPLTGCYDSRGDYHVGLMGLGGGVPFDVDLFDARVLPWWLSDTELDRVHNNGVNEINRRGIPQWR